MSVTDEPDANVAEVGGACQVMVWPWTGAPAPSTSLTTSGAPAGENNWPDWLSPDCIVSCGGRMFWLKVTFAVASSARTANTWKGAGPGPVLVTEKDATPKASVTLVPDAGVAPPVVVQLMVTPATGLPLLNAVTCSGAGSGAFGGAVWLLPPVIASVRVSVELMVKVWLIVGKSARAARTVTVPGVGPRSIT